MSEIINLSRRRFLGGSATLAGGLVLGVYVPGARVFAETGNAAAKAAAFEPNVFIRIATSGDVTIMAHRSEMGQGVRTGLPAIVADELEADWSRVTVEQAIGDPAYGSQNTDGSRSVRKFWQPLREAGAAGRYMLIAAAAAHWGVDAGECVAREHAVHHEPSGRSIGYGELAADAAQQAVPKASKLTLKERADFRYIGKSLSIVDMDDMVTGKAGYGIDATLPGMVHAAMLHPPAVGATVKSVDASAARQVKGVEAVETIEGNGTSPGFRPLGGVAVVASNSWAAQQAVDKLQVDWDLGPNAGFDSEEYRKQLEAEVAGPGVVVRDRGDVAQAMSEAAQTLDATYYAPLLAHAPMEPPAALARFVDGKLEVWAPTQAPQRTQSLLADYLGIDAENITVHVTLLGGAFGRKSKPDFIIEAAELAKRLGKPVKMTWTREEDVRHDFFHADSVHRLQGGLDDAGRAIGWLHRAAYPPIGGTFNAGETRPGNSELGMGCVDVPFAIDNLRVEKGEAPLHVRIGWLRSVANVHQAFAVCSFADELAVAAGRDPKDYLLELIGEPRQIDLAEDGVDYWNYGEPVEDYPLDTGRLRNVVELVADKAGWGRDLPDGHGLGITAHRSFLTYVAMVSHVSVDADDNLRVHEVTCAVDCGTVVNPDRVKSQMEGAVIFGLSAGLHGRIDVNNGSVQQGNFDDYPVLRIDETPAKIDVHIVDSEALPTGIGEPGVPPVTPSVTNAIHAATGKRYRELPLSRHFNIAGT